MLCIELGTADGDADEEDLFGMVLGADNVTSHGALLDHGAVDILLGSAAGAAGAAGATAGTAGTARTAASAANTEELGIKVSATDGTTDGTVFGFELGTAG